MRHQSAGFTLIELLVVVAVIALVSAVALPNFLEAQTRSKVAAATVNVKTVRDALEIYSVDNNAYPPVRPLIPEDPFALLADQQLHALTTPIAYLAPSAFRDPFGTVRSQRFVETNQEDGYYPQKHYPLLTSPNPEQSLMYFHYISQSARLAYPAFGIHGVGVVSIGPDLRDSLGGYRPFSKAFFDREFYFLPIQDPVDTIYDPTNGTLSEGDIPAFGGPAQQFVQR